MRVCQALSRAEERSSGLGRRVQKVAAQTRRCDPSRFLPRVAASLARVRVRPSPRGGGDGLRAAEAPCLTGSYFKRPGPRRGFARISSARSSRLTAAECVALRAGHQRQQLRAIDAEQAPGSMPTQKRSLNPVADRRDVHARDLRGLLRRHVHRSAAWGGLVGGLRSEAMRAELIAHDVANRVAEKSANGVFDRVVHGVPESDEAATTAGCSVEVLGETSFMAGCVSASRTDARFDRVRRSVAGRLTGTPRSGVAPECWGHAGTRLRSGSTMEVLHALSCRLRDISLARESHDQPDGRDRLAYSVWWPRRDRGWS